MNRARLRAFLFGLADGVLAGAITALVVFGGLWLWSLLPGAL